jgi:hypothetical protein
MWKVALFAPASMYVFRKRFNDGQPKRQVWNEVSVHNVDVNPVGTWDTGNFIDEIS